MISKQLSFILKHGTWMKDLFNYTPNVKVTHWTIGFWKKEIHGVKKKKLLFLSKQKALTQRGLPKLSRATS